MTAPAVKSTENDPSRPPRGSRRLAIWGVLICVIGLGLWWMMAVLFKPKPAPPPASVPVVVAAAQSNDVPVYLTGLGQVQAYNTVTIHSQVDGTLQKVTFVEGQDVKSGELLA